MTDHRVFIDANVLVSSALGDGLCRVLFDFAREGKLDLVTSVFARSEALANVQGAAAKFLDERLLPLVEIVGPELTHSVCPIPLAAKDVPILGAAVAARATHLVTGDRRHFGTWFDTSVEGVRVCSPRGYFRERGDLE